MISIHPKFFAFSVQCHTFSWSTHHDNSNYPLLRASHFSPEDQNPQISQTSNLQPPVLLCYRAQISSSKWRGKEHTHGTQPRRKIHVIRPRFKKPLNHYTTAGLLPCKMVSSGDRKERKE